MKLATERACLNAIPVGAYQFERTSFPTFWKAIVNLDVLVAVEAEVDEPLAIEQPGRFLQ